MFHLCTCVPLRSNHIRSCLLYTSLTEVKQLDDSLKLTMYERAKIDTAKIPEILNQYPEELQFKIETNPYFLYRPRNRKAKEAVPMQEKATELLTVMQCLV